MKQLNLKLHEATINNMRAIALAGGYVIQKSDRKGEGSIAAWLNDIYGEKQSND